MTLQTTEHRQIEFAKLDSLLYDPDNPRLPEDLPRTDSAILGWMLEDASIVDLMGSIGAQGYFPGEPLLGVGKDGAFLVVEGNRRLAATKLLADPSLAPTRKQQVRRAAADARFRPSVLPTLRFDNRDDILDYLGYRHVTGVKEWEPLAKARYVKQLVDRAERHGGHVDMTSIARKIGSRRDYVERLLTSLKLYEQAAKRQFYELEGVDKESIDFSVLSTAVSYEAIAQWVGLESPTDTKGKANDDRLKLLIEWSFKELPSGGTALGESRHLTTLAEVVKSERAVDALENGATLAQAAEFSEEARVAYRRAMREAQAALERARDHVHRLEAPSELDVETAQEVFTIARFIRSGIEERHRSGDDD
jgi:hypothetical protein